MRKQNKTMFSVLELLIAMTIMAILSLMVFVVIKGVKDGARTVQTEATINTCKVNVEHLNQFIVNQTRLNNLEVYEHPIFSKVWTSNRMWTFRDEEKSDKGITSNGLKNMINIGNLGVENKSITLADLKYPDMKISSTLIDGWGHPILLMRNELPWFVKKLKPGENIIENVYKDRTKTTLGIYAKYMPDISTSNKNLYEFNDASFNHVDSKGVNEPSYEVAPLGTDGYRSVGSLMYGKVAVPYNNNDFDFLSVGKDGKIGNLIKNDNKQDRWSEIIDLNGSLKWVPTTIGSSTDPDGDNIITFNRYRTE